MCIRDRISEGTALYLDGELTAVCSNGSALRDYLAAMLDLSLIHIWRATS